MDSHAKHKINSSARVFGKGINNIPVAYEDTWVLIMNKPQGLLTIPTPKNEARTLTSILNLYIKEKGMSYRLHPCHRLDRETSGLIIYAKGKSVQKKMMQEFKDKKVKKIYILFVKGRPLKDKGAIKIPLESRKAITNYRIIEKRRNFTIVEAMPITGRTNQLRIHFKRIGHPILGETKYAFRRDFKLKAKRLCLHAKKIEFIHPVTKSMVSLNTELPSYMRDFLSKN